MFRKNSRKPALLAALIGAAVATPAGAALVVPAAQADGRGVEPQILGGRPAAETGVGGREMAGHVRVLADENSPGKVIYGLPTADEWPVAKPAAAQDEEQYEIVEEAIGDDGQPITGEWETLAVNMDTVVAYGPDETVPPGDYVVYSLAWDAVEGPVLQIHTLLDLAADTTVTFDTREATPVDMTVFDAEAEPIATSAGFTVFGEEIGIGITFVTRGSELATWRTQYSGSGVWANRLSVSLGTSWAGDDGEYHAGYESTTDMFNGFSHQVIEEELAEVDMRAGSPTGDASGWLHLFGPGHSAVREIALPHTTTAYFTGGGWYNILVAPDPGGSGRATLTFGDDEADVYEPGKTYQRTFNVGPFGPSANGGWLYREGDSLLASVYLLADTDGNVSESVPYEGSTTLTRNGETLLAVDAPLGGKLDQDLPTDQEPATYELTSNFRRPGPLSTWVEVSFRFDSATTAEAEQEDFFSMVEFNPELASDSTASAGEQMTVPVAVYGAAEDNADSLVVEVSYDSGESWQEEPVTDDAVSVDNPDAGGSVSFRGTVTDSNRNVTTVTIIDAYRTVSR